MHKAFVAAKPHTEPVLFFEDEEDFRHTWPKAPYLSEREYARSLEAFPRVCSDVLAIDPVARTLLLAKRIHPAGKGRWGVGGGQRRGQTPREAASIHLKEGLGITVVPEEFVFLFSVEMYWRTRNPEPQNLGEHDRILTYCFVPTQAELEKVRLDPREYDLGHGLQPYGRDEIAKFEEGHKGLLLKYWDAAFGA